MNHKVAWIIGRPVASGVALFILSEAPIAGTGGVVHGPCS
jgi:hypothetical protein